MAGDGEYGWEESERWEQQMVSLLVIYFKFLENLISVRKTEHMIVLTIFQTSWDRSKSLLVQILSFFLKAILRMGGDTILREPENSTKALKPGFAKYAVDANQFQS